MHYNNDDDNGGGGFFTTIIIVEVASLHCNCIDALPRK